MNDASPTLNESRSEQIESLRLKVKAAVLIGGGRNVVQEYLQELHALTIPPVRPDPQSR